MICQRMNTDISIERVVSDARQNTLPIPVLKLDSLNTTPPPSSPFPSRANTYIDGTDPWSLRGPESNNGAASGGTLSTGLGRGWYTRQSKIEVSIAPKRQGFILARYTVYQISSDVSGIPGLTEP